jgi:hypothetical protein
MHVVSVNLGMPREVEWDGRMVLTGIFKSSVAEKLPVRRLKIEGDGQANLAVQGGPDKAVHACPSEHYGPWGERLGYELTPGIFGENLSTEGLLQDAVHIGDEFRVGTARLVVTQPRMPCFKLGIRFGDPGWSNPSCMLESRGSISPSWRRARSAPATRSSASPRKGRGSPWPRCSVSWSIETPPPAALRRLLDVRSLAAVWRKTLEKHLEISSHSSIPGETRVADAGGLVVPNREAPSKQQL